MYIVSFAVPYHLDEKKILFDQSKCFLKFSLFSLLVSNLIFNLIQMLKLKVFSLTNFFLITKKIDVEFSLEHV